MKVLIAKTAQEELGLLNKKDKETINLLFEIMESEHFPKLKAFFRSDNALKDGLFVRSFEGLKIIYRFMDDKNKNSIVVLSILPKTT